MNLRFLGALVSIMAIAGCAAPGDEDAEGSTDALSQEPPSPATGAHRITGPELAEKAVVRGNEGGEVYPWQGKTKATVYFAVDDEAPVLAERRSLAMRLVPPPFMEVSALTSPSSVTFRTGAEWKPGTDACSAAGVMLKTRNETYHSFRVDNGAPLPCSFTFSDVYEEEGRRFAVGYIVSDVRSAKGEVRHVRIGFIIPEGAH